MTRHDVEPRRHAASCLLQMEIQMFPHALHASRARIREIQHAVLQQNACVDMLQCKVISPSYSSHFVTDHSVKGRGGEKTSMLQAVTHGN
jgi:hypothetical protein